MYHREISALLAVAIVLLVTGLTIQLGTWSLVGCGAAILLWTVFIDEREE